MQASLLLVNSFRRFFCPVRNLTETMLCDVALSVEHTASPGMCALEEDGMQAVLVLHREKFVQTKECMEITVHSFYVSTQ